MCLFLRHFKIALVALLAPNALSTLFPEQAGEQLEKILGYNNRPVRN